MAALDLLVTRRRARARAVLLGNSGSPQIERLLIDGCVLGPGGKGLRGNVRDRGRDDGAVSEVDVVRLPLGDLPSAPDTRVIEMLIGPMNSLWDTNPIVAAVPAAEKWPPPVLLEATISCRLAE